MRQSTLEPDMNSRSRAPSGGRLRPNTRHGFANDHNRDNREVGEEDQSNEHRDRESELLRTPAESVASCMHDDLPFNVSLYPRQRVTLV